MATEIINPVTYLKHLPRDFQCALLAQALGSLEWLNARALLFTLLKKCLDEPQQKESRFHRAQCHGKQLCDVVMSSKTLLKTAFCFLSFSPLPDHGPDRV